MSVLLIAVGVILYGLVAYSLGSYVLLHVRHSLPLDELPPERKLPAMVAYSWIPAENRRQSLDYYRDNLRPILLALWRLFLGGPDVEFTQADGSRVRILLKPRWWQVWRMRQWWRAKESLPPPVPRPSWYREARLLELEPPGTRDPYGPDAMRIDAEFDE